MYQIQSNKYRIWNSISAADTPSIKFNQNISQINFYPLFGIVFLSNLIRTRLVSVPIVRKLGNSIDTLYSSIDSFSLNFYKILSVEKSYTFFIRSFSLKYIKTAIHKKLGIIFILWNLENFYQILFVRTFYTFISQACDWKYIKFDQQQILFISIF